MKVHDPNEPETDYWTDWDEEYRTRHPVNVYLAIMFGFFVVALVMAFM